MSWKSHGLIFLVILTIFVRLYPIFPDKFPFMFDHAKDSLVMMQMGTQLKPSLVGAITSIPGVYYGPAWYYLALPLNVLLEYHPLASVLTVIFLAVGGTWLAWKYLGELEAALWATSFGLIGTQTSAWSPYLTPLIVLPILTMLLQLKRGQKMSWWFLSGLAFLVSLSFHFQPAFSIVLMPLVLLILFLLKLKINWRNWLIAAIGFGLPFLPHFVFELRHDFHQTRELVNFFSNYGEASYVVQPNDRGLSRLWEIGSYVFGEAGNSISPINIPYLFYWGLIVTAILLFLEIRARRTNFKLPLIVEERIIFYTLLIGSWAFYLILPAKQYYFVALIPVWLVLSARLFRAWWPRLVKPTIGVLIILALIQARLNYTHFTTLAAENQNFLHAKMKAIKTVYALGEGKPFVVYHSLAELYDYPYQHLYRYLINHGYPEPVEYSYAPGEVAHMLAVAPNITQSPPDEVPDNIFLVVERPTYGIIFDQWWDRVVAPLNVGSEVIINTNLKVYPAQQQDSDQ